MTYLNIMNNVLRRLREEEVNSTNESTYAKMAGDFINDAKSIVEDATDWSALRDTVIVNTVADDNQYSLTGCGDNVKIMSALNTTEKTFLTYQTKDWFNEQLYIASTSAGSPVYYTFDGLDANGDTQFLISPQPDGVYTLRLNVIKRQADLSNDATNLLVPEKPVIHLAVALLARERGETGGTSTAEYFTIANQYLSDAIAIDAAKHPEEMVFRTI